MADAQQSNVTEAVVNDTIQKLSAKDFVKLSDNFAEDVRIIHTARGIDSTGKQLAVEVFSGLATAFPDIVFNFPQKACQGDVGFVHCEWEGTHTASFGPFPPTNRHMKRESMMSFQVVDGKVSKLHLIADRYNMLKDLGVDLPSVPTILSDPEDIRAFAATLNGEVVTPLSANYKQIALLANADIESKPAVIIHCQGVSDVIKAIAFCKDWEKKHPEAPRSVVRGGGHSFWGASTNIGGCIIDLRKMRSVVIDPSDCTAWVDGGATVRELDREAFAYGLVMPSGQINHTGIGGLTTGGGYGLLTCKFGLMSDNLVAIELVLADGRICQCSAKEYPDLFWACKGGARWLGVVTRFKFQLHKLATPTCSTLIAFDAALTEKCYWAYRRLNASTDAFAMASIASPPQLNGAPVFVFHLVVFGGIEQAKRIFDGLVSEIGAKPLAEINPLAERPWLRLTPGWNLSSRMVFRNTFDRTSSTPMTMTRA